MNRPPQPPATDRVTGREGRSIFVPAADGLQLHIRDYGPLAASSIRVVCLPGLARTTADFAALAPALAYGVPERRVVAIDSRGRGLSEYDADPQNYNVAVELNDIVTVLKALQINKALFIGSSRGGILTMLLAASHPATIAGAVLNDIGPVIEPAGVARIKGYVGKLPQPQTLTEGAMLLRKLFGTQFPKLTDEQWHAAARRTWKVESGALAPTYDVRLAQTLADVDFDHPLPSLWKEFDALSHVPVLLIRGANSDILSPATVTAMRARHPALESIEVPDQGHVPLLEGPELCGRISDFARKCDR